MANDDYSYWLEPFIMSASKNLSNYLGVLHIPHNGYRIISGGVSLPTIICIKRKELEYFIIGHKANLNIY